MEDWCNWCASYGKTHARFCDLPRDAGAELGCTCVPVLCAMCRGESTQQRKLRAERFVDNVTKLHRANRLLKAPLGAEERDFVEGFVRRLADGQAPRITDHFRLRELEKVYVDPGDVLRRSKRPLDS